MCREYVVSIVPGLGVPKKMLKLFNGCILTGWSAIAYHFKGLLNTPFMPGYVELICSSDLVFSARENGFRVYFGKKHYTVSDGVWCVRVYNVKWVSHKKPIPIHVNNTKLYVHSLIDAIEFVRKYGVGKRFLKHISKSLERNI